MRNLLKLAGAGLLIAVTGCCTTGGSLTCNSCSNNSSCSSCGHGSRIHDALNNCTTGVCDCDISPLAPYGLCAANHSQSALAVQPADSPKQMPKPASVTPDK